MSYYCFESVKHILKINLEISFVLFAILEQNIFHTLGK